MEILTHLIIIIKTSNLLSVLGLSLALATSASAITFNFTLGNSGPTSSKTYTVDGLTVTVTAHSWSCSAWDANAKVGQYNGGGLGVTNSGSGDSHTVGSCGWIGYLKFSFTPVPADVNSVSIGYVSNNADSDFRYWLNNSCALSSTGGTAVNGTGPGSYNLAVGSNTEWHYLIIAADRDNSGNKVNEFKISGLTVTPPPGAEQHRPGHGFVARAVRAGPDRARRTAETPFPTPIPRKRYRARRGGPKGRRALFCPLAHPAV